MIRIVPRTNRFPLHTGSTHLGCGGIVVVLWPSWFRPQEDDPAESVSNLEKHGIAFE